MLSPTAKMIAIPLAFLALAMGSVGGLLTTTYEISNQAAMATVDIGVFWDITCTEPCTKIDWGSLVPGENKTLTLYVKNVGEASITGSFNTSSWSPPLAAEYISLAWDFGEAPLDPGRVRETAFILMIAKDIHDVETFYFIVWVIGTQHI